MPELYHYNGYSEVYQDDIETLKTAPKKILLAVKTLAASGCATCDFGGRFPNLCQALIDEKKKEAA